MTSINSLRNRWLDKKVKNLIGKRPKTMKRNVIFALLDSQNFTVKRLKRNLRKELLFSAIWRLETLPKPIPSNYRLWSPPKGCNCTFQNVLVFPALKLKTLRTADINSSHIKTVLNHSILSSLTTHDKSKIRKRVLFIYKPVWVIKVQRDRIIAWFSME